MSGPGSVLGVDEAYETALEKDRALMNWKDKYTKTQRPRLAEINEYLFAEVSGLFTEFNRIVEERYGLGYAVTVYSDTHGWKYKYGHSGLILVNNVCFHDGIFSVEGIQVNDENTLNEAIYKVDQLYNDGFMERFMEFAKKRSDRTKQKMQGKTKPQKEENLNNCRWPAMVSRQKLKNLYKSDVKMMLDEELLDDIGLTIYTRCMEAKEIYALMSNGKVKCMHCGKVLDYAKLMECPCGQRYTYHEYRRSYRTNNMPRGEASDIFDKFITDWEKAKGSRIKMLLIDNLIHEFHISSITGTPNRPVGINLIQGSKEQVTELIEQLAYGSSLAY